MHRGCVFCKNDPLTPVRVYSDCAHRDRHVNILKIVQPAGASKYLSKILSLHPFSQLRRTSISGRLCFAISGAALDPDICLTFLIPLSQRHGEVPHTSVSRCLNTLTAFPSFFIRNMKCVMEANTGAAQERGQISLAGPTATARTCVTPRKHLLGEHKGVTASTNIASDHKSDFSMFLNLTACRFL